MYLSYEALSKKEDVTTFVPQELLEAQKQGKKTIPIHILNHWDNWVADKIGLSKEEMWEIFSAEQIDSIGLTIMNFEYGKGFIIADETGIGKGRILSGICRWAFLHGKRVLFFTEREHLFTDFWRDLIDTDAIKLIKEPVVFHTNSKVFNPQGELVLKGTLKEQKEILNKGIDLNSNFVMTNYSQIGLKNNEEEKKKVLINFCKKNVIIMDESHNATGNSNTKKFLLSLMKAAGNVVFSSATFMKDESQLDLYEQVIDFDKDSLGLLKKILDNDKDLLLRKVFTYELTRKLQLWRREHEPLQVGWKTLICDEEDKQLFYLERYSSIINGIFHILNKISSQENLKELDLANNWFVLGATINRLSRNLLLLFKTGTLIKSIKECVKNNHKAVIVIDSTFASIINKVINNQSISEDGENDNIEINKDLKKIDYELNFKQVLLYLIEELLGKIFKKYGNLIGNELKDAYEILKDKTEDFKSIGISPIDTIIEELKKEGIDANEISGRSFRVVQNKRIEKIEKQPKSQLVKEFNDGKKDVIIITRAGASGISLHASAIFKDQKIRNLYELEITSRPTYRLQFIGRVNRKNQVVQPEFYSIVTKLPFEQRILNMEQQKLKKLQSHVSGDDEKLNQENIYNFYTTYCDECMRLLLNDKPMLAYQMGISLKKQSDDFYFVDNVLKRCIVLKTEEQNFLYDYLLYCTHCETYLRQNKILPQKIEYEKIKTFWHHLNEAQQNSFKLSYGNYPEKSINQFKYPWVGIMKIKSTYHTECVFLPNLMKEYEENQKNNSEYRMYFKNVFKYINQIQIETKENINNKILPLLQNIELGKAITIKTEKGNIFGYIHNIIYPHIENGYKYPHMCLLHIKTINPLLHESIFYSNEDYYISLKEVFDLSDLKIENKKIDWEKYRRSKRDFHRINYGWVGNPIYMEFLRHAYRMGDADYFQLGDKKYMCTLLPSKMLITDLLAMKKPIYNVAEIMDLLIAKKIKKLTTTWEEEKVLKPSLKLEPIKNGYLLSIAKEIFYNSEIVDFGLKKKLTNYKGNLDGFLTYIIPYREIRFILMMLEKRHVIWFMEDF